MGSGESLGDTQKVSEQKVAYPALTSIRFFAAFAIVIHHFGGSLHAILGPRWLPWLASLGNGVRFFFVLSGFILTYVYFDRQHGRNWHRSWKDRWGFYQARFYRVYPIYALALCLSIPQVIRYVNLNHVHLRVEEWFTFLLAKVTLTQAWLPVLGNNPPMLQAAWSLSCEAFFYAVFPFLFVFLDRLRLPWLLFVLGLAAIFPLTPEPLLPANPHGWGGVFNDWFPAFRVGEFVVGMCFGFLAKRIAKGHASWKTAMAWVSPFFIWAMFSTRVLPIQKLDDALDLLSIGTLLISWLEPGALLLKLLASPVLTLLGASSYALYLFHGPVFGYITKGPFGIKDGDIESSLSGFIAFSLLAILVSVIVHLKVEEPLNTYYRRRQRQLL